MLDIIANKNEIREKIEKLMSSAQKRRALKDYHARRKPRPCGITIHTGVGCSLRCLYCYIEDMGFKWDIKPYPLNDIELVYSLLSNPYFLPGKYGTLIAIGSVTEPFHPITKEKTFKYIEALSKYLGNFVQFSTKMYLTEEDAYRLKDLDPGISPLVTIITLEYASKLEPYAPSPEERFETIKNLSKAGLKPILFYRPLIPGIVEYEYQEIIKKAFKSGAVGVVAGSLRITKLILSRLKSIGVSIDEIVKRLPRQPGGNEQVTIIASDLKKMVLSYAKRLGLIPFTEACMANIYTHGCICWKMISRNIVVEGLKPPTIDEELVYNLAKELGIKVLSIRIKKGVMELSISGGDKLKKYLFSELVKYRFRICTRIRQS